MSSSTKKLPLYEINGNSPYEIGYNYGVTLKDRIKATVQVYYDWFLDKGGNDKMLEQQCQEYEYVMRRECPSICEEIYGISQGSGEILWKIYLLNCRTEIYNVLTQNKDSNNRITECSGIMNVSDCLTAQNWDWIENMHENAVLLRINKPRHTMLMLIEPGMVGKIGLNSSGIGCTLFLLQKPNFVMRHNTIPNKTKGIPIHVILRLFLECKNLDEIDTLLQNITVNTYSCIGVADNKQNGYFLEFCGAKFEQLYASKQQFSFHTNHYLGCGLKYIGEDEASNCSLTRYKQLKLLYDANNKLDNPRELIQELLTNNMHKRFPICRHFVNRKAIDETRKIGTISTVTMDLKQKTMKISRGTPLKYPFETIYAIPSIPSKL